MTISLRFADNWASANAGAVATGDTSGADAAAQAAQLRNLIDETPQIQAAKAEEIVVKPQELDRAVARFAENNKQTVAEVTAMLESNGSSVKSIRRQIEGEVAWSRLQRAKIESSVSVGDEEGVPAILPPMPL